MKLSLFIIVLIIFRTNANLPLNDFTVELKDNGANAIDITSQGAFTFILRSDNKIYKWDGISAFVFFQGPANLGVDYLIRSITVNELGVIWACADNYDKLFKYINSAWTELTLGGTPCYNVKIGYGPLSKLYLAKEGDKDFNQNHIYYLNASNGFTMNTYTTNNSKRLFAFSSQYSGRLIKLFINIY